jgi:hypothetical protein
MNTSDVIEDRLHDLELEVAHMRDELACPRCSTLPPPPSRWGGDPKARYDRDRHTTCGRSPWSP